MAKFSLTNVFPPIPSIKEKQQEWIDKINKIVEGTLLSGFDYEFKGVQYHFSFDEEAQRNLSLETADAIMSYQLGQMTAEERQAKYPDRLPAALPVDFVTGWRGHTADGAVTLTMSLEEFLSFAAAAGRFLKGCLANGWELKAQISATETEEALKAKAEELQIDKQWIAIRDRNVKSVQY